MRRSAAWWAALAAVGVLALIATGLALAVLRPTAGTAAATGESASPTASPSPSGARGEGDLGLAQPIANLRCGAGFITFVTAAVAPDRYVDDVAGSLRAHPGAAYLRNDASCAGLYPTYRGNPIYQVYFGPFSTAEQACAARSRAPADSEVRLLEASQLGQAWSCT